MGSGFLFIGARDDLGQHTGMAIMLAMTSVTASVRLFILVSLFPLLVACVGEPPPTPTIAWTPIPAASIAPLPTATPTAASSSASIPSTNCINDAVFLEDLTIPDQTLVDPGSDLDKRWAVQNSGSCDWGPGYRLLHVSNDAFIASDEITLYPASAGSTATWQVQLTAPIEPGEHISIWQARAPDGALFGEQVYLWVIVAAPEVTPTSRGTPTN